MRFVLKEQFGPIWSGCYSTEDFDQIKYSGGRIGRFMAWPNGIDRAHCRRIDPSELIYRAEMRSNQITEDVF